MLGTAGRCCSAWARTFTAMLLRCGKYWLQIATTCCAARLGAHRRCIRLLLFNEFAATHAVVQRAARLPHLADAINGVYLQDPIDHAWTAGPIESHVSARPLRTRSLGRRAGAAGC